MAKRLFAMLVCLCLLAGFPMIVLAEEISEPKEFTIDSLSDFLTFAENCRLDSYSWDLIVELQCDIDLSGTEFTGIPIFSGTFRGNGYTVSGLRIRRDGSAQGLFRYLTTDAAVKELKVQGTVEPGGSRDYVGGIVGSNAGVLENCSFSGTVTGADYVGGIVGCNALSGVINGCTVEGSISANHFGGGIAGENEGVIRNCTNLASVNTTPQQNTVDLSDITLDTITGAESANTVTDIGGIAGISSGVIRRCENMGNVGYRQMGYNVGGIVGSQSGYVVYCENYGSISGRKEVGGIAGQLEPVARVTYTLDTLQILSEQMDTLSALTGQATYDAQNGAANIARHIAALADRVDTAREALEALLQEETPDADSIRAAANALTDSLSAMSGILSELMEDTSTMSDALVRDMQAITNQVNAMSETVNQASENLGGSVKDASDADTAADTTAKVDKCKNYGTVLADLNAGGIAGAVALENDLDPEDDVTFDGKLSMNFAGEFRAVIRSCENIAAVTVKKQYGGGIVGRMSLGLVKDCSNTGYLDGTGADYIGGIAGMAGGFIRNCDVKCRVSGKAYVGGIAGTGSTVTDCRSMVLTENVSECFGAVLGWTEEIGEGIQGNYYLAPDADVGGIDGISYSCCAEPLADGAFYALEGLNNLFKKLTVTFLFEDGTTETVTLKPGEYLATKLIPAIPEKAGYTATWEGLEDLPVSFDTVYRTRYVAYTTTVQSDMLSDSGLPVVLTEGSYEGDTAVTVARLTEAVPVSEKETVTQAWSVMLPAQTHTLRLFAPEDGSNRKLLVRAAGVWQETGYTVEGSYLVFPVVEDTDAVCLVQLPTRFSPVPWLIGCGAAAVILWLLLGRRKKTQAPAREESPVE